MELRLHRRHGKRQRENHGQFLMFPLHSGNRIGRRKRQQRRRQRKQPPRELDVVHQPARQRHRIAPREKRGGRKRRRRAAQHQRQRRAFLLPNLASLADRLSCQRRAKHQRQADLNRKTPV